MVGIADANDSGMNEYPVDRARKKSERAFGLVELLVMIAVIVVLAGLMMPRMKDSGASAARKRCVNNLKNVGLAFRLFPLPAGDKFPGLVMMSNGIPMETIDVVMLFGALSNELSDPKVLICPADKMRKAANFVTNVTSRNISYFASLSADETLPQGFLAGDRNMATSGVAVGTGLLAVTTNTPVSWTKDLHVEHGNIAMGDGSVQQMSSSRLKQSLRDQDLATNYLVFP